MNEEERFEPVFESWLHDTDVPAPDARPSVRQVKARLPETRQLGRWRWLPRFQRSATAIPTTDQPAGTQPAPIPATNGRTPTLTGRTHSMFSPAKAITAGVLVFAMGSALFIAQPFDQQGGSVPGAATVHAPSSASAGCDEPLVEPGVYDGINDFEDAGQGYRVVVPESYADLAPAPLIVSIATDGGSLDSNFEYWKPYLGPAESVFVIVESVSTVDRAPETLTALIDELTAGYCVDQTRVHAMGQSTSASTAARLACYAPDRIGSFFVGLDSFHQYCTPEQPVPIMAMTGDPGRRSVTHSVEARAETYSCEPDPIVEDLGSGVTRSTYQGCLADIVLYDVEGVGRGFIREACLGTELEYCYANDVFDQLRDVERFFAEHPLRAAE